MHSTRLGFMSVEDPFQPEQRVFSLAGLRLWIVEADADTRLLYANLFEDYGAQVLAFASVAEALEMLEFQQPHLLMREICLPDEDGQQMIHKLQQLKTSQGQISTITVTPFAKKYTNQRQDTSLSKFQKCFTKPITLYELVSLVAELMGRKSSNRKRQ